MRNRLMIIVIGLIIGVSLCVCLSNRYSLIQEYIALIESDSPGSTLNVLANIVDLAPSDSERDIDIGYMKFSWPFESLDRLEYRGFGRVWLDGGPYRIITTHPSSYNYELFRDGSIELGRLYQVCDDVDPTWLVRSTHGKSSEAWHAIEKNDRLLEYWKLRGDRPYDWHVEVLNTTPKPLKSLILMNETDLYLHLGKLKEKHCLLSNTENLWLIKVQPSIHALAYSLKSDDGRSLTMIEIWNETQKTRQFIQVSCIPDQSLSTEAINTLLKSIQYPSPETVPSEVSEEMILQAISNHPNFVMGGNVN